MDDEVKYLLHVFSDSFEKDYTAVVYMRCDYSEGIQCHLVNAKTKYSPLKPVTIPCLELCGVVLAAQLLHYEHEVHKPVLSVDSLNAWTNSTTTLASIKSHQLCQTRTILNHVLKFS